MAKRLSASGKSHIPPSATSGPSASSGSAGSAAGSGAGAGSKPSPARAFAFEYLLSGAGSHKTTELCQRALAYLVSSKESASSLVLTTYSRDAAAQLLDRVRTQTLRNTSLSWAEMQDIVTALDSAVISTNHALGRTILEQHWVERRAVPSPVVIDRETYDKISQAAIRKALRSGVPTGKHKKLNGLILRLGRRVVERKRDGSASGNVMRDIRVLMDMVPESGMPRAAFVSCCASAVKDLSAALASERKRRGITGTAKSLCTACRRATRHLLPLVSTHGGITLTAFKNINDYLATRAWHRAHALRKAEGHKKGVPTPPHAFIEPVAKAAKDYHLFPEFADDLVQYVELIAGVAYEAYGEVRSALARAGRIDFQEMEQSLNTLLEDPAIRTHLAHAYGFIGIDEAQDMTAASARAFEKLTEAVAAGAWIADPNQSIYEFRGSDYREVQRSAQRLVTALSGSTLTQGQNHRSQPGVIRFVNDLFHILTCSVCPAPPLPEPHAQDAPVAKASATGRIERWSLQGPKLGDWCAEVAEGVARLRARTPTPVADEDICILVRTNDAKAAMAAALEQRGIPVAMRSSEVALSREGRIVLSAIRLMLNEGDSLAEATLQFLLDDRSAAGVGNPSFDQWLQHRLGAAGPLPKPGYILALEDVRQRGIMSALSPTAAVVLAVEATGLIGRIAPWGNGIERQSRIDAMITLAEGYENTATTAGRLATVGGFVAWCEENRSTTRRSEPDAEPPPKEMPGVRLMTCHASKGLGNKVTVMACFGMPAGVTRAYGISKVGGNPYAIPDPLKDCENDDLERIIGTLPASIQRHRDALAAETQLLYVGLTRSEQELVIAHPKNASDSTWLTGVFGASDPATGRLAGIDHFLDQNKSATTVSHPLPAPPPPVPTTGVALQAAEYASVDDLNVRLAGAAAAIAVTVDAFDATAPRALSAVSAASRYCSPSGNATPIGGWKNSGTLLETPVAAGVVRDIVTPTLISAAKGKAKSLGNAFHAFMAAIPSLPALDASTRPLWESVAMRCLHGFLESGVVSALGKSGLTAAVCVDRGNAFVEWCREHLGVEPSDWIVEAPVAGPAAAGNTWRGRIDLLTKAKSGDYSGQWVLVDHKAVLATTAECVAKTDEYLGEVSAYADALSTQKPGSLSPRAIFIHFPFAGAITAVSLP